MVNRMILQGRLCADPELRTTNTGISVCSFRVAWSETYKENERKLFLSCTAWRGTGEMISKYFHKGKEIVVEGALVTNSYEDKDGNKRSTVEMTVDKAHFCGAKDATGEPTQKPAAKGFIPVSAEDDGDVPF